MNRRTVCTSKNLPSLAPHVTDNLEVSPSCPLILTRRRERQVAVLEPRGVVEQVKEDLGKGDMGSH